MAQDNPSSDGPNLVSTLIGNALHEHPAFAAIPDQVFRDITEWPAYVIPDDQPQRRAALATLASKASWPHHNLDQLLPLLVPLYQAGWSNEAITYLLDHNLGGDPVHPPVTTTGAHQPDPAAHVTTRLQRWFGTDPHDPPTAGSIAPIHPVTFDRWARLLATLYRQRRRGHHPNPRGDQAFSRTPRRRNPRPHGHTAAPGRGAPRTPTLVNELMLLLDPDVHQALREFTAAAQRTREHTTALRRAVARADRDHLAHQPVPHGRLAELAATITRPDGTPVPRPTLRFLLERAR